MQIADAQREVRTVFLGGSTGMIVSGTLWLISTALAVWGTPGRAIAAMVIGGMFIFPVSMLVLKLMRRPVSLPPANPMGQLATQAAFVIPFCYPVIGAATLHNLNWFYPAFMVVVGAHYLPFTFLYGMWLYAAIAVAMVLGGVAVGTSFPHTFAVGGWITGIGLILCALPAWALARAQDRSAGRPS